MTCGGSAQVAFETKQTQYPQCMTPGTFVVLREMLNVVTLVKPGVEVYRVVRGRKEINSTVSQK